MDIHRPMDIPVLVNWTTIDAFHTAAVDFALLVLYCILDTTLFAVASED